LPVRDKIVEILELLTEILFPGYTGKRTVTKSNIGFIVGDLLCEVYSELCEQIERVYKYRCRMENCDTGDCKRMAEEAAEYLVEQLPKIREMLKGDVGAAFDGDPAAKSYEEIVISYPCITAIATYRIAHELYLKDVPLIPRLMTECHANGYRYSPGENRKNFFIDHERAWYWRDHIIGDNVKFTRGRPRGVVVRGMSEAI
jgi:serine O-acetyltransferase